MKYIKNIAYFNSNPLWPKPNNKNIPLVIIHPLPLSQLKDINFYVSIRIKI